MASVLTPQPQMKENEESVQREGESKLDNYPAVGVDTQLSLDTLPKVEAEVTPDEQLEIDRVEAAVII